jgi:2-dehydropantoate 2-reductase
VRVIVFGVGAVGSRFGAALARAGHTVTLIGRGPHVAAIHSSGLVVEGDEGDPLRLPALERLPPGIRADLVLLTVKSYDVRAAGRDIARALLDPVPVVALQNGLGIEETLEAGLRDGGWDSPRSWIVRSVHTVPARIVRPGAVAPTGDGEVVVGRTADLPERAAAVEALFAGAEISVRVSDEIDREVWRKALINAAINPVTADHGIANGQLADEPWRGQAQALLEEALVVAGAEGYAFDPAEMQRAVFGVARATADNHSSMLEDLERGRPTEIDAISGAILAAGRRHGIAMPAMQRAVDRIHAREAGARSGP